MIKLISIFYKLLCEIFFDSKEQYDFRSEKFNGLRFGGVVVFLASVVLNVYLTEQYWKLSSVRIKCEQQLNTLLLNKIETPADPSKAIIEQKNADEEDNKLSSLAAQIAEKKKATK